MECEIDKSGARMWREHSRSLFYQARYVALPRAKAIVTELQGRTGPPDYDWNALMIEAMDLLLEAKGVLTEVQKLRRI
jgi:hypothetical protein